MKYYFIIAIIITFSTKLYSQEKIKKNSLINSFTTELKLGAGGGYVGLAGRADHWWLETGKLKFQSGLSLSLFYGAEKFDKGPIQISGYNFDTHLQLHTGIEQSFFLKERIYVSFDMYAGLYNLLTSGKYKNLDRNTERDYKNNEFIWDFGSSFGFGYRIKEKWGIQLSVTNSWRAISEFGLIGLIVGQPDAKFSIGLGVNYRL